MVEKYSGKVKFTDPLERKKRHIEKIDDSLESMLEFSELLKAYKGGLRRITENNFLNIALDLINEAM